MDHFVYLWEITEQDMIGHWPWAGLSVNKDWDNEIVMPAFKRYRQQTLPKSYRDVAIDLSSAIGNSVVSLVDFCWNSSNTYPSSFRDNIP